MRWNTRICSCCGSLWPQLLAKLKLKCIMQHCFVDQVWKMTIWVKIMLCGVEGELVWQVMSNLRFMIHWGGRQRAREQAGSGTKKIPPFSILLRLPSFHLMGSIPEVYGGGLSSNCNFWLVIQVIILMLSKQEMLTGNHTKSLIALGMKLYFLLYCLT